MNILPQEAMSLLKLKHPENTGPQLNINVIRGLCAIENLCPITTDNQKWRSGRLFAKENFMHL